MFDFFGKIVFTPCQQDKNWSGQVGEALGLYHVETANEASLELE